ncbi:MCE family protein [Nocardia sp. BMG51109]|uniref:MCE family protein n=1 Tax=Nocardia sp. BMG51109 TaxID=1056816 RepID=UPI0004649C77|nr:MCE family protein [Nocardia sp. BMG51109]
MTRALPVKLGLFVLVMLVVNGAMILVFTQVNAGSSRTYHAVFADASGMKSGAKVRIAGVPVGQVGEVSYGDDHRAHVEFSITTSDRPTTSTRAAIRYEDLVGNRYLELQRGPDTAALPANSTIEPPNTAPALDLDALLGGFQPLLQALDPKQVNELSLALLQIFQGRTGTVTQVLQRVGGLTATLADHDQIIDRVITNLNTVLGEIASRGDQFSSTLDHLQQLVSGLAQDRDVIGRAVTTLDDAADTFTGLLTDVRPDLAATVGQMDAALTPTVNRIDTLDAVLGRLPEDYRKLTRTGAYGSFFNFYLCGLSLKVPGPDGDPKVVELTDQKTGRCAPNP